MATNKAQGATVGTGEALKPASLAERANTGKPGCVNAAEGLYCLVNYKGNVGQHRWVFRYPRPDGKGTRELGLGTLVIEGANMSGVTLSTARELARENRDKVAKGIDPADERKAAKQANADAAEDADRVAKGLPARNSFKQYAEEYAGRKRAGDLAGVGEDKPAEAAPTVRTARSDSKKAGRRRAPVSKWSDTTFETFNQTMANDVYPAIGNMNVADIETEHIYQILVSIEQRGALVQMHRARKLIECVFEMVRKRRIIEENPASFLDVSVFTEHFKMNQPAVKTARELQKVLLAFDAYAVRESGYAHRRACLSMNAARDLTVLTAQRAEMITGMQKAWIDFDGARAGEEDDDKGPAIYYPPEARKLKAHERIGAGFHVVPLSTQAAAILREQCARSDSPTFVFQNLHGGDKPMHVNSLNESMQFAMGKKGCSDKDWNAYQTAHGLRAVFRTFGEKHLGIETNVLESILAHKTGDKELGTAYSRNEYTHLRRDAMQRYADWIDAVRAGKLWALNLPKTSLSQATLNRQDAEKWRELEASGKLAAFLAWTAAQDGSSVSLPVVRTAEAPAANARQAA